MKKYLIFTLMLICLFASFFVSCANNIEKLKKQAVVSRTLGEAYMQQKSFTAALKELLEAEKIYEDDPILQNDLGLCYMTKKKYSLAAKHFKKACELNPSYTEAKNNLGTAYLAKKDWDAAIDCFNSIVGDLLYTTPQYPLSNLGWAYYNKKKYKTAIKYYVRALDIRPGFNIAVRGLILSYAELGKFNRVKAILNVTKLTKNQKASIYFALGNAYVKFGEYEEALKAYITTTELSPYSKIAKQAKIAAKNLVNKYK